MTAQKHDCTKFTEVFKHGCTKQIQVFTLQMA